ncbi:hypothetical protein BAUCODRAFT_44424, partial [Baudoinia panamericana UAMH 10762]
SASATCPSQDGNTYTANGVTFHIECGLDRYGNDIGLIYTNTYNACLDACGANGACVD